MQFDEERESTIRDALRYLAGDRDDGAEDAYFSVDSRDVRDSLAMLSEIALRSKGIVEPIDIGIGLLDSLIWRHGNTHPELIAETILGNSRLIQALTYVRGLDKFPQLKLHFTVGKDGDT